MCSGTHAADPPRKRLGRNLCKSTECARNLVERARYLTEPAPKTHHPHGQMLSNRGLRSRRRPPRREAEKVVKASKRQEVSWRLFLRVHLDSTHAVALFWPASQARINSNRSSPLILQRFSSYSVPRAWSGVSVRKSALIAPSLTSVRALAAVRHKGADGLRPKAHEPLQSGSDRLNGPNCATERGPRGASKKVTWPLDANLLARPPFAAEVRQLPTPFGFKAHARAPRSRRGRDTSAHSSCARPTRKSANAPQRRPGGPRGTTPQTATPCGVLSGSSLGGQNRNGWGRSGSSAEDTNMHAPAPVWTTCRCAPHIMMR